MVVSVWLGLARRARYPDARNVAVVVSEKTPEFASSARLAVR
jgi:hypothetical protein